VRDALPADVSVEDLIRAGGVGDLLGWIVDDYGQPIEHPVNDRVIGITLDDLSSITDVIMAAGGLHKVPVIRAALRRGTVQTLVTDEGTARALLETA
jgi:DNA-binding transcriptional regulator LsrR (DeoR family)